MGDAKKLCDRMWEMMESGKLEKLGEIMDADCDVRLPGMTLKGVDQIRQVLGAYNVAFPDLRHHVRHFTESSDAIALELEVSGTHTGPMQMPQGAVPASNNKLVLDSCDYIRVRDGKITSWHGYYDMAPMMKALGLS